MADSTPKQGKAKGKAAAKRKSAAAKPRRRRAKKPAAPAVAAPTGVAAPPEEVLAQVAEAATLEDVSALVDAYREAANLTDEAPTPIPLLNAAATREAQLRQAAADPDPDVTGDTGGHTPEAIAGAMNALAEATTVAQVQAILGQFGEHVPADVVHVADGVLETLQMPNETDVLPAAQHPQDPEPNTVGAPEPDEPPVVAPQGPVGAQAAIVDKPTIVRDPSGRKVKIGKVPVVVNPESDEDRATGRVIVGNHLYFEAREGGGPAIHRKAPRGTLLDLPLSEYERGIKNGGLQAADLPVVVDEKDPLSLDDEGLATWVRFNSPATVVSFAGNPEAANRLLAAESAGDHDPRAEVLRGISTALSEHAAPPPASRK